MLKSMNLHFNVFVNIDKYVNKICISDYCVKILLLTFYLVPMLEV